MEEITRIYTCFLLHQRSKPVAAKVKSLLATCPPTWHAQGLMLPGRSFYWLLHCPRPEPFLVPHHHVMNNNTQRRIPHQNTVILPIENPSIPLLGTIYIDQVIWPVVSLTLFKIIAQDLHTLSFFFLKISASVWNLWPPKQWEFTGRALYPLSHGGKTLWGQL